MKARQRVDTDHYTIEDYWWNYWNKIFWKIKWNIRKNEWIKRAGLKSWILTTILSRIIDEINLNGI